MQVSEILSRGKASWINDDQFGRKVLSLVNGPSLFGMRREEIKRVRRDLIRSSLQFFAEHSAYHADLFERLDIKPSSVTRSDLVRLAVPSDMLRGEGQRRFLIDKVEEGGQTFTSSGTTGKDPVRVYRSPFDLMLMLKANTDLFEYVYGHELERGNGVALFMAAKELADKLSFVAFVDMTLENKGIELIYGMDVEESDDGKPWLHLKANRDRLIEFLKSKKEPKLFFSAPAGVHLLGKRMEELSFAKRVALKASTGAPPIDLGKGGVVVTGGGSKGASDLPPHDAIVSRGQELFRARDERGKGPAPFMDVLGMTETLTALIDRTGAMGKVPHPLSEVIIVDQRSFEPIEEDGKEGLLVIFNPFVTSWMECFYPGDLMSSTASDCFYGREFKYSRRLTVKEGWTLQRACGGSMEEMMEDRQ
jgi:phenylacetate-CoA ligase